MASPIYPSVDNTVRPTEHARNGRQQQHHDPVDEEALIRLKILTPLSVLLSLASNVIVALAVSPSMGTISKEYLTFATPSNLLLGIYWLVCYTLQVGYALLVVTAQKDETKRTIVNGVGLRFVFVSFLFTLWPVFWVTKVFIVAEIILLIIFILLVTIALTLLKYGPDKHRPLDFIFIHAPMRLFLLALWNVDIWQNGSIALGCYKYVGNDPPAGHHSGSWEDGHDEKWVFFGIFLVVGMINAFVTFIARDAICGLATIYLFIAILLGRTTNQAWHTIPLIFLCVLQLVALLASYGWTLFSRYQTQREGKIRLSEEAAEGNASTSAPPINSQV